MTRKADTKKSKPGKVNASQQRPGKQGGGGTEAKTPYVIDGETGAVDPIPSPIGTPSAAQLPLSSALDVRREQAKIFREARGGTMDKADAAKLIWMLGEIRKSIETYEIEQRLMGLEERLSIGGNRQLPTPYPARAH
jgi:hypothetical protein